MKNTFTKVVGAALAFGLAMPASVQALFDGYPSKTTNTDRR
jgi:metallo-beta-lactamase class B